MHGQQDQTQSRSRSHPLGGTPLTPGPTLSNARSLSSSFSAQPRQAPTPNFVSPARVAAGVAGAAPEAALQRTVHLDSLKKANLASTPSFEESTLADSLDDGVFVTWLRLVTLCLGWSFCVISWIMGAFVLPTLRIRVMPGTNFANEITRTLSGTLVDLWNNQTYFAFTMLFFFSVVVPSVKLFCTVFLLGLMFRDPLAAVWESHEVMIRCLTYLASYQLTDLFVGVLFVGFFSSDSADAEFLVGFYWFFSYCMVSMACSVLMEGTFSDLMDTQDPLGEYSSSLQAPRAVDGFKQACPVMTQPAKPPRTQSESNAELAWTTQAGERGTRILAEYAVPEQAAQPLARHWSLEGHGAAAAPPYPYSRVPVASTTESPRDGHSAEERELCALGPKRYVDLASAAFFSLCFIIMGCTSFRRPVLEVRTLWEGVAVDRSSHSMYDIFFFFLPSMVSPLVAITLVAMNVILPFAYILLLILTGLYSQRSDVYSGETGRIFSTALEALRPWVTADVFTLATLIFLFTVQQKDTLTLVPSGWGAYAFYLFLGAGFSFFFLRWFTEASEHGRGQRLCSPRFCLLIGVYAAVCASLCGGVPGAAPHFDFPDLNSVCKNTLALVNSTIASSAPAAYGDCSNLATNPPQPCKGNEMLYDKENGDGFIQAVWMGGLDTMSMESCHLWSAEKAWDRSRYHLTIGGRFAKMKLFLHVKQCGAFGCAKMNSADHCCGEGIGFKIRLSMDCLSKSGRETLQNIRVESCEIDPMMVKQEFLGGHVKVDALDISPQVEGVVKKQVQKFIVDTRIPWAGSRIDISQLLRRLIGYNSPERADDFC